MHNNSSQQQVSPFTQSVIFQLLSQVNYFFNTVHFHRMVFHLRKAYVQQLYTLTSCITFLSCISQFYFSQVLYRILYLFGGGLFTFDSHRIGRIHYNVILLNFLCHDIILMTYPGCRDKWQFVHLCIDVQMFNNIQSFIAYFLQDVFQWVAPTTCLDSWVCMMMQKQQYGGQCSWLVPCFYLLK